jgi:transposase-like protein
MPKKNRKRKKYPDEFKAEAVRLVLERGDRTVGEIAQSLGVNESLLHSWKRREASPRNRSASADRTCCVNHAIPNRTSGRSSGARRPSS